MSSEPLSLPPAAPGAGDFAFGDRTVRPSRNRIEGPAGAVAVEPKVMELLVCLARHDGEVVSKETLVREVWEGRFVTDDVVWRGIAELRRALGPEAIETVPKRGYRLCLPALPPAEEAPPPPVLEAELADPAAAPAAAVSPAPRSAAFTGWALGLVAALGLTGLVVALQPAGPRASRPVPRMMAPRRLAVLPFRDGGGPAAPPYLAAGLTEALASELARVAPARLAVVGESSVAQLLARGATLARFGLELKVDSLLEGSVVPAGDGRLKVHARLLKASDLSTTWSTEEEVELARAPALTGEIARRVAHSLAGDLLPREPAAAALPQAASAAYLEGLYFLRRGTPDELAKSRAAFTRAVAEAPAFAPAQAGLADALFLLTVFGRLAPAEGFPAAEAAARRALALAPQDGETRATLGSIRMRYHLDWEGASIELARARALAPQSARVHHDSAWLQVDLGRFDFGVAEIERARRLDPLSLRANADVGWVLYRARRPRQAVAEMRRLLALEPRFTMARLCLERALVSLGELEAARDAARQGLAAAGLPPARIDELTAGDAGEALRRVAAFRLEQAQARGGSAYAEAALAAELGDTETALRALDRAFAERDPARADLGVDPAFDPLRPDPRFAAYVARLGRPAG